MVGRATPRTRTEAFNFFTDLARCPLCLLLRLEEREGRKGRKGGKRRRRIEVARRSRITVIPSPFHPLVSFQPCSILSQCPIISSSYCLVIERKLNLLECYLLISFSAALFPSLSLPYVYLILPSSDPSLPPLPPLFLRAHDTTIVNSFPNKLYF